MSDIAVIILIGLIVLGIWAIIELIRTYRSYSIEENIGMVGNGRSGAWYVEIEENLETEKQTLLIDHPFDQIEIPLDNTIQDISDLISALQQLKQDLERI